MMNNIAQYGPTKLNHYNKYRDKELTIKQTLCQVQVETLTTSVPTGKHVGNSQNSPSDISWPYLILFVHQCKPASKTLAVPQSRSPRRHPWHHRGCFFETPLRPSLHENVVRLPSSFGANNYPGWWLNPTPLKNISQLLLLVPISGKIHFIFQTTNQYLWMWKGSVLTITFFDHLLLMVWKFGTWSPLGCSDMMICGWGSLPPPGPTSLLAEGLHKPWQRWHTQDSLCFTNCCSKYRVIRSGHLSRSQLISPIPSHPIHIKHPHYVIRSQHVPNIWFEPLHPAWFFTGSATWTKGRQALVLPTGNISWHTLGHHLGQLKVEGKVLARNLFDGWKVEILWMEEFLHHLVQ